MLLKFIINFVYEIICVVFLIVCLDIDIVLYFEHFLLQGSTVLPSVSSFESKF